MSRLKQPFCALIIALALGAMTSDVTFATCTGADPCHACKDCKYCQHCAKNGGTCGVCKRSFKGRSAL